MHEIPKHSDETFQILHATLQILHESSKTHPRPYMNHPRSLTETVLTTPWVV